MEGGGSILYCLSGVSATLAAQFCTAYKVFSTYFNLCAASGEVGELLDRAVLIYRLGAVQAFKGSQYQLQGQDAALAQVRAGRWQHLDSCCLQFSVVLPRCSVRCDAHIELCCVNIPDEPHSNMLRNKSRSTRRLHDT